MAQMMPAFNTNHHGPIHDAQLDYYGKLLASSSADHTVKLWDLSTDIPRLISDLIGHEGPVWEVSWAHPKYGNLLASCSYDRKIFVWKEQTPGVWGPVYMSDEHTSSVNSIEFAPWELGLHIACGSSDGTVSVHTYTPETAVWTRKAFLAHPNGVLSVSWCPVAPTASIPTAGQSASAAAVPQVIAPKRLATSGADHQVRVWNFVEATYEWIESSQMSENRHTGWVRCVSWRPNTSGSNLLASASDDGNVIIWQETDNQTWKNKQVIPFKEPVWKTKWSVTGAVLAAATSSRPASLFKENLQGVWEPLPLAEEIQPSSEVEEILQQQLHQMTGEPVLPAQAASQTSYTSNYQNDYLPQQPQQQPPQQPQMHAFASGLGAYPQARPQRPQFQQEIVQALHQSPHTPAMHPQSQHRPPMNFRPTQQPYGQQHPSQHSTQMQASQSGISQFPPQLSHQTPPPSRPPGIFPSSSLTQTVPTPAFPPVASMMNSQRSSVSHAPPPPMHGAPSSMHAPPPVMQNPPTLMQGAPQMKRQAEYNQPMQGAQQPYSSLQY